MASSKRVTPYMLLNVLVLNKVTTVGDVLKKLGMSADLENLAEIQLLVSKDIKREYLNLSGESGLYVSSKIQLTRQGELARRIMAKEKNGDLASLRKKA